MSAIKSPSFRYHRRGKRKLGGLKNEQKVSQTGLFRSKDKVERVHNELASVKAKMEVFKIFETRFFCGIIISIYFDLISASGGKNATKWNYNENFV